MQRRVTVAADLGCPVDGLQNARFVVGRHDRHQTGLVSTAADHIGQIVQSDAALGVRINPAHGAAAGGECLGGRDHAGMFDTAENDRRVPVVAKSEQCQVIRLRPTAGDQQSRAARLIEPRTKACADRFHRLIQSPAGGLTKLMQAGWIVRSGLIHSCHDADHARIDRGGRIVVQIDHGFDFTKNDCHGARPG